MFFLLSAKTAFLLCAFLPFSRFCVFAFSPFSRFRRFRVFVLGVSAVFAVFGFSRFRVFVFRPAASPRPGHRFRVHRFFKFWNHHYYWIMLSFFVWWLVSRWDGELNGHPHDQLWFWRWTWTFQPISTCSESSEWTPVKLTAGTTQRCTVWVMFFSFSKGENIRQTCLVFQAFDVPFTPWFSSSFWSLDPQIIKVISIPLGRWEVRNSIFKKVELFFHSFQFLFPSNDLPALYWVDYLRSDLRWKEPTSGMRLCWLRMAATWQWSSGEPWNVGGDDFWDDN